MPGADNEQAEDVYERRKMELQRAENNRYTEARKAGLEHGEAIEFSVSQADVGVLRWLVKCGCPVELRAKILV